MAVAFAIPTLIMMSASPFVSAFELEESDFSEETHSS